MTRRRLLYALPAAVVAVVLAVVIVAMRGIPGQTRPHRDVGTQAQAVRDAFNAASGTVRIIALVSPTCGACLRGTADLQTQVFDGIASPNVRALVVWVPKLRGRERDVDEATHTIPDPRAVHFWDGDSYLVHAFNATLNLGQDAWDIYLLYGPNARWDTAQPPVPQSWMHQLSGVDHPKLDAATLAEQVRIQLR
jgi:hypothetical protein